MSYIVLIANVVVLGLIAVLLVRSSRGSGNRGYLVLLAGLMVFPGIRKTVSHFITEPAIDSIIAGEHVALWPYSLVESGTLSLGELLIWLGATFSLVEYGLILAGLWLVVRSHKHITTPSNTRLQLTGAVAPAAEPQIR